MATLTAFDIDDTLFRTKARTLVIKDGKVVNRLDSKQIQEYQLKEGESYDWTEFASAEYFFETSVPIVHTINLAKKLIAQKKREPNDKILLITARPDLDDKDKFLSTFRKHGLDTDQMYVARVGDNESASGSVIAARKVRVIKQHLTTGNYNLVQMFEDSKTNLKAFIRFSNSYPHITFHAYLVNSAGKIVPFK
jgi:hypothetical protein